MTKSWNIYDGSGVLINTIVGTEERIQEYCTENGYTYELDPNWVPPLTDVQKNLIKEYNWVENRISGFLENHIWANSRETFTLAVRQYNAMVDYYLVLHERIVMDGLDNRLDEGSGDDGLYG